MSDESIKEWVKTCSCNSNCSECDKSLEECRQDLYKVVRSLLTRTKLPTEEEIGIYT